MHSKVGADPKCQAAGPSCRALPTKRKGGSVEIGHEACLQGGDHGRETGDRADGNAISREGLHGEGSA
eukprot:14057025-Heterocapsa_arctica.AAC.1